MIENEFKWFNGPRSGWEDWPATESRDVFVRTSTEEE